MICDNCKKEIVRFCQDCGVIINTPRAIYCGSIKNKEGCAYKRRQIKQQEYVKKHILHSKHISTTEPSENIPKANKYNYWFTA